MNKTLSCIGVAVVLLLAGCSGSSGVSEQYRYTPPTPVPVQTSAEVDVPYDLLWLISERPHSPRTGITQPLHRIKCCPPVPGHPVCNNRITILIRQRVTE